MKAQSKFTTTRIGLLVSIFAIGTALPWTSTSGFYPQTFAQTTSAAPEPKETTVPDSRYGEGGTKTTTLDDKVNYKMETYQNKEGFSFEFRKYYSYGLTSFTFTEPTRHSLLAEMGVYEKNGAWIVEVTRPGTAPSSETFKTETEARERAEVIAAQFVKLNTAIAQPAKPSTPSEQSVDGSERLQTFIKTDFYAGLIDRALNILPPTIFQRCPALMSNGSRVTILRPVIFAASGYPNAGVWKQTFPVSGCGNDTIWTIYFSAGADEKINTRIAMPGTTIADLRLQDDSLLYANVAAGAVQDCKNFIVKNTRFETYGITVTNPPVADPGPNARLRPWSETWTMIGCNHTVEVPFSFAPDGRGTRIMTGKAVER